MKKVDRFRGAALRRALPGALLVLILPLAAQEFPQFKAQGGVNFPLTILQGAIVDSAAMYKVGAEASATIDWALPFAPFLGLAGSLGYDSLPLASAGTVHLPWLAGGLDLNLISEGPLRLKLGALGGYSYFLHTTAANSGGGLFASLGTEISFAITRAFQMGLSASYRSSLNRWEAVGIQAGARLALGDTTARAKAEIQSIKLDPLFPVFLKWYGANAAGLLRFKNNEKQAARNVRASLFIKEFMDSPSQSAIVAEVAPGQSVDIPLYALLSDRILGVTEAMKLPAEITVTYDAVEPGMKLARTETARVENRNAMNWADDRRAASFITPKDPTVLKFSKSLAGRIRSLPASAFDLNFRVAMGIFEALRAYGVNYVVDPSSSYAENSAKAGIVDYLQFPRQTLEYRAGDCDDLSILFCALLESVGIETAFITVPGHIFAAFATTVPPGEIGRTFGRSDLLLVRDGKAWVPVEITMLGSGFLNAWMRGAQGWAEGGAQAKIFPVHEAWTSYEAVGLRSEEAALSYPLEESAIAGFERELGKTITMDLSSQESKILAELAKDPGPKNYNRLGSLYARYGVLDKAREGFQKAAEAGWVAAMHNLGSVAFLSKDFALAETWYRKALGAEPANASARLSLARSLFELGRMPEASAEFDTVRKGNPDLAAKYSYLGGKNAQAGAARAEGASSTQAAPIFLE